jgi:uncharacterized membrane protein
MNVGKPVRSALSELQKRQADYVDSNFLNAWYHKLRLNAAKRRFDRIDTSGIGKFRESTSSNYYDVKLNKEVGRHG